MRRLALTAAASALVCVAASAATGCAATVTGARREGPAPTATVKEPDVTAPALAADPTALAGMVRRDSSVSAVVREDLEPCVSGRGTHRVRGSAAASGTVTATPQATTGTDDPDSTGAAYPLDTDSGYLTAGDGPDLVVNVTTCGDGLGIASYVYRMTGAKYRCVFADERSPVYGSVIDGRLQIVHEVYRTDDSVAYPTGEDSATYAWNGDHFLQVSRSYFDFRAKTPTAKPEPVSTIPVPLPDSELLDPGLPTGTSSKTAATSKTGTSSKAGTTRRTSTAAPAPTSTTAKP